jgi:hypothetical protein
MLYMLSNECNERTSTNGNIFNSHPVLRGSIQQPSCSSRPDAYASSCFRNDMYTPYPGQQKHVTKVIHFQILPYYIVPSISPNALLETLWRWRLLSAIRYPPSEPKPCSSVSFSIGAIPPSKHPSSNCSLKHLGLHCPVFNHIRHVPQRYCSLCPRREL